MEYGAVQYLVKPVGMDALVKAVERGLTPPPDRDLEARGLRTTWAFGPAGPRTGPGLEASLTRALDSLWMAYQPIVRAADGQVYGYEALLRSERAEPAASRRRVRCRGEARPGVRRWAGP